MVKNNFSSIVVLAKIKYSGSPLNNATNRGEKIETMTYETHPFFILKDA